MIKLKPFRNKLHEYLRTRNITQKYFATVINVDEAMVSRWISNKAKPTGANAKLIAKETGLRLEDLL